jgi:hypothetical protein
MYLWTNHVTRANIMTLATVTMEAVTIPTRPRQPVKHKPPVHSPAGE